MKIRGMLSKVVVVTCSFSLGIFLGTVGLLNVLGSEEDHSTKVELIYPVNENGQTYGSSMHVQYDGEEPDLIRAYGKDGTIGYVTKEDLDGEMPSTPEEALAINKKNEARTSPIVIPLYDKDGTTIIGQFEMDVD